MAKTIFLSNNLVTNAALSVVNGTQNAQFPLSNIQKDATTNVSRIGAVSVVSGNSLIFSDTWTSNSFTSNIAQNGLLRPSGSFTFANLAGGAECQFSIGFNSNASTNHLDDFNSLVSKVSAGELIDVMFDDGTNSFTSRITAIEDASNATLGKVFSIAASDNPPSTNLTLASSWTVSFLEVAFTNAVRISIQLPTDTDIDTVAVVGSNLDGFGYSNLTIRTSLTSDFGSSEAIAVDVNGQENFGYAFYTERLARYVQLEFLNTGAFVEISKVFVGKRVETTATLSRDGFVKEIRRNDEISENKIGNRFVNILNARTYYTGLFPIMEQDQFLIIEELFLTHGSYKPIWVMLDPDNKIFNNGEFKMSTYAYINNIFSHDLVGGGYFNVTLELLEVV